MIVVVAAAAVEIFPGHSTRSTCSVDSAPRCFFSAANHAVQGHGGRPGKSSSSRWRAKRELGSVAAMYAIINVSTVFPLFAFDADLSRHYGCLPKSSVSVSRRISLVGCPLTL